MGSEQGRAVNFFEPDTSIKDLFCQLTCLIFTKDGERLVAASIQDTGCIVQVLTR